MQERERERICRGEYYDALSFVSRRKKKKKIVERRKVFFFGGRVSLVESDYMEKRPVLSKAKIHLTLSPYI